MKASIAQPVMKILQSISGIQETLVNKIKITVKIAANLTQNMCPVVIYS